MYVQENMIQLAQQPVPRQKRQIRKIQSWWNVQLNNKRHNTEKLTYKNMIKETKMKSLREYLTNNDPTNPWETTSKSFVVKQTLTEHYRQYRSWTKIELRQKKHNKVYAREILSPR